ncbi:AraC family transcriptional regulator [Marnyiella aurantia]|uniref:AraC family transcriptional regulator n=1 Tax=Marnyiella aurantia TaxID=2758037 RepID=A0A7D7LU03_9FLAO|nr:helix-turn-helix domain-containing protein [Marnyiella aurantia]MBA5245719.1 AraC family transcriptional regulator [Marnyiella aurantia]QMS98875.1 AraC family transcriptional regulator [Marnyiella aurantia]
MEQPIQIFNAKNIFDYIEIKHPYHPKNPAFLILRKGRVVYNENVNRIELSGNHVALIDSRRVYEILEISQDLELLLVAFSREYTEKLPLKINRLNAFVYFRNELVRHFGLEPEPFERIWKNADLLKTVLESNDASTHRDEIIRHLFSSTVYQFGDMIAQSARFTRDKISRKQEIVLQFLKNVGDSYLDEREVTYYAEKQFITSRHLSAVLKAVTGQTAGQIIAAFVMKEARAQISSTDKTLQQIAADLKFSDVYSFGHFFKKHSGEGPNVYRKRFRG